MKIKTITLVGLMGSTLLLTGGGGGGGGASNVQPTVLDGYNLAQGSADAKKGATYVQEFLTANSAQNTTVANIYSRLNVPGVEQAHLDGWTGKRKTITILDSGFTANGNAQCIGSHGRCVSDIAHNIAPGVTRNEYGALDLVNSAKNIATMALCSGNNLSRVFTIYSCT